MPRSRAWLSLAPHSAVTPAWCTRRRSSSIRKKTYSLVRPIVCTVRTPQARAPAAWARRNWVPAGAAAAGCRAETVAAKDHAHRCRGHRDAELAALPGDTQVAPLVMSRASRSTSSTTSGSSLRRRLVAGYVHRRRISSRWHRSSVDGVTKIHSATDRGSSVANVARTIRSPVVSRGRATCRVPPRAGDAVPRS
jgi:hypothetical protein